jgi:hypothetical protein
VQLETATACDAQVAGNHFFEAADMAALGDDPAGDNLG